MKLNKTIKNIKKFNIVHKNFRIKTGDNALIIIRNLLYLGFKNPHKFLGNAWGNSNYCMKKKEIVFCSSREELLKEYKLITIDDLPYK